jgi:hypothetical protein
VSAAGEYSDEQRDRREREHRQQQDLREDHAERERAEQRERAELPEENQDRQQQPLVLAALAHRFGRWLVGLAEGVAAVVLGWV